MHDFINYYNERYYKLLQYQDCRISSIIITKSRREYKIKQFSHVLRGGYNSIVESRIHLLTRRGPLLVKANCSHIRGSFVHGFVVSGLTFFDLLL